MKAKGITRSSNFVQAVDLFCGAGGLTRGLEQAGIDVILGVDTDPACEFPYTRNNNARFVLKSVEDLNGDDLLSLYKRNTIKVLAGCAPCQTFSKYNQKATSEDKRWWLLLHFARLIEQIQPEVVTMENVPGLVKQNVFHNFLSTLEHLNYDVDFQIVNCAEYGLPQQRQRLVLLASRLGPIKLLGSKNFKKRTVRDAIGCLPGIDAGETYKRDRLHQSARLSEKNIERLNLSTPGGTWRDWPDYLVADCHKRETGATYPSVYGRMSWDEPSPTITTQFYGFGNGRFGHPEQNRAISLREGAILQTFPKSYEFVERGKPVCKKTQGRLIGNAVPVQLGKIIGRTIIRHVSQMV